MKMRLFTIITSAFIHSLTVAQSEVWRPTSNGLAVNSISALRSDPFGNVFVLGVFQAQAHALYKSSDDGLTWNNSKTTFPLQNFDISQNGYLFLGGGEWVYRSTDNGTTWNLVAGLGTSSLYPSKFLSFDYPNLLFFQEYEGSRTSSPSELSYSSDNGESWHFSSNGQYGSFVDIPINSVGILSDSIIFASTASAIFVTFQGPAQFHLLQQFPKVNIHSLYCSQSSHNVYMLSDSVLFCSSDTGQTWNASDSGLSTSNVLALKANSKGEYFACTDKGLFVSKNSGQFWSNIGLQQMTINSILFNDSSAIIVTGNQGIFYSTNEGSLWIDMNSGLSGNSKTLLTINSDGYAFVLCDNTIYRTVLTISQITSAPVHTLSPARFSLEQNYPNPFNPSTTIVYNLDKSEYVRLDVFDVLGRKVETLVDQIQLIGKHQALFNGSMLSAGIYFCQLYTEHSLISRKMVLIK